jgi:hypothetical protein
MRWRNDSLRKTPMSSTICSAINPPMQIIDSSAAAR